MPALDDTGSDGRDPSSRRLRLAILAILALFSVFGCERRSESSRDGSTPEHPTSERENGSPAEGFEIERSDSLPDSPERIVSLAPNVTETLFALGAGDRIVGVTKYCTHPDAATEIPSVGSFANPDFETILARNPDVVLGVISGGPRDVFEQLEETEISFAFYRMSTVEQTYEGIRAIGRAIGEADRAERVVSEMRTRMRTIARRWRRRTDAPPRVLLVYGHEPLVGAGSGTFGHQLLERAGARNVLADSDARFPRLDAEKVLELQPERILDTAPETVERGRAFWERYDMLQAVRDGQVAILTDSVVLRPGPRLPEALRRMARAVHGRSPRQNREGSK